MARPKKYTRHEALASAVETFWETGYSATTMRSLIARTGVGPKSLYAEFGNKDELFLAVVDAYIAEHATSHDALSVPPFGLERLREHFAGYRFEQNFQGCLLIGALAERASVPRAARVRIDRYFQGVRQLFERHLSAAQSRGEIAAGLAPTHLAHALLVFDQGLAIAGTSETQRADLTAAAHALLDALDARKSEGATHRVGEA